MNQTFWLLAVPALLPLLTLAGDLGPAGRAAVPAAEKPPKPPKPTKKPDEDKKLDKAIDKWSRTERGKLQQAIDKFYPAKDAPAPAEGSDAEFAAWFDRLAGGPVWRLADVQKKSVRELFARIAARLEVRDGEISRQQFLAYARQYLSPQTTPLWDEKPSKGPAEEAAKLFRKLDGDKDGALNAEEMPAELAAQLGHWDRDHDGRIGVQEYQAYFEGRVRRAAHERGAALPGGTERERGPAPAELRRVYRAGRLPAGLPAWFRQLDRDEDGQVGLYEWKTAGRHVEEDLSLDRNGDGFITAEEALRARPRSVGVAAQR